MSDAISDQDRLFDILNDTKQRLQDVQKEFYRVKVEKNAIFETIRNPDTKMIAHRAENDSMRRMLEGQVLSSSAEKKRKRRADALSEMPFQYYKVAPKVKKLLSVS